MSATAKHRLRNISANKINPSMLSIPISDEISAQMSENNDSKNHLDELNEDIDAKNANGQSSRNRITSLLIGGSIGTSFVVVYSDIPLTLNLF